MLEILSHQYLKKLMRSKTIDWEHIYSFGRIISKCIQNKSTYLINSEIFLTSDWVFPILISLFLNEENSTFVLSEEKINFLKNSQVDNLKILGFEFVTKNNEIILPNHRIQLTTLKNLLGNADYSRLKNHRIIFSGVESIKKDLKNHFRISLFKKDWFNQVIHSDPINQNVIRTYNVLKKKFFFRGISSNKYLFLDEKEIGFLSEFFYENASFSNLFSKVSNALLEGWACWVELDHKNLDWNFYLEPIDELYQINKFINNNKFIFLSALRKDNFFKNYLKQYFLEIDLVINFKSNFNEKKISLYLPPRQMLPNNPLFTKTLLEKCKKLIFFRNSMTLILCDDNDLKTNLATELASEYGKRVLLETLPLLNNEILLASYDWWIHNSSFAQIPEQIIITLLPVPNISEPINLITIAHNKKRSRDWFREFLLPEASLKLERAISPLRRNSGKIIVLDGRANKRKWGSYLLDSIQPSKKIQYMLPFD